MCVFQRERERERKRGSEQMSEQMSLEIFLVNFLIEEMQEAHFKIVTTDSQVTPRYYPLSSTKLYICNL